jgi:hypothetical protein
MKRLPAEHGHHLRSAGKRLLYIELIEFERVQIAEAIDNAEKFVEKMLEIGGIKSF